MLLRTLEKDGAIKSIEKHGKQALFYPTVAIAEKTAVAADEKGGKKGKKK